MRLPTQLPPGLARTAHESVGGALARANRTGLSGHPALANSIHAASSSAFFDGFGVACLVVAGVSAASAIVTVLLLPAHPALPAHPEAELVLALPADDQGSQLTPGGRNTRVDGACPSRPLERSELVVDCARWRLRYADARDVRRGPDTGIPRTVRGSST
jgi:hypothetical protein